MKNGPDEIGRLAVYGSLAPGASNHHVVETIAGEWRSGWVEGSLVECGWGAAQGFPAIRPQPGATRVDVQVLESSELDLHWERLDAFEGAEYERVMIDVHGLEDEPVRGWIYALRQPG